MDHEVSLVSLKARWGTFVLAFTLCAITPCMAQEPTAPVTGLMSLGFAPSALAASGASVADVERLVDIAHSAAQAFEACRASRNSLSESERRLAAVERSITQRGVTAVLQSEREAAQAEVAANRAACEANEADLREQLYDALESGLSSQQLLALHRCVENRDRDVPPQYRVLGLDSAEWATLRSALTKSRAGNQDLTPSESQLLSAANANPDVILAAQRLQESLNSITQAFNTAIAQSLQQP